MRFLSIVTISALITTAAIAGPERVVFPDGYGESFVLYDKIDKPDRKVVRFMYLDPVTDASAEAKEPLPHGAIIVMEDHGVELDGETPRTDAEGRLIATDEVVAIAVMEKQQGWGNDIAEELRNGDWDYAAFQPDGTLKTEAPYNRCFECHLPQAAEDFTFSVYPYLANR